MKKIILHKKTFAFLFFFVLLSVPFFVSSQSTDPSINDGMFFPLVRCGRSGQPLCDICDLFEMIGRILGFILFVIIPSIATLMIMISGIMFFTASGDPGKIEKSKNIIKSVVIGLLISFLASSAVVALYNVLGAKDGFSLDKWNEICIREHRLKISIEGSGMTNPEPGTYTYDDGEEVTIEVVRPIPDGYSFKGYSGDCESFFCKIIMNSDKTVTAIFEKTIEDEEENDNEIGDCSAKSIGSPCGGGFVASKKNGYTLIAAKTDISEMAQWGCYDKNAEAKSMTNGIANTAAIIRNNDCGMKDIAPELCDNYEVTVDNIKYIDWYLPTRNELDDLFKEESYIGNFSSLKDSIYWSSTEHDKDNAWGIYFDNGEHHPASKLLYFRVRCVRQYYKPNSSNEPDRPDNSGQVK